jgi:hypothetical protein
MKQLIIILIIFNLAFSSLAKKINISTYPIGSAPLQVKDPVVYCLPLNVLKITFEISRNVFIKGPYCAYAEKYLGIKDIIQNDSVSFNIENINLETIYFPDTSKVFLIENASNFHDILLKLADNEKIYRLSSEFKCYINSTKIQNNFNEYKYRFNNLSIYEFMHEKNDTLFRNILRDSVLIKVPYTKKTVTSKPLEMKAEEAAREILKARKRKQKLITGQYPVYPQGDALKHAVDEIEKFENEYLPLFTGKSYNDNIQLSFYYIPDTNQIQILPLFYFNTSKGFSYKEINDFSPVNMVIEKLEIKSALDSYFETYDKVIELNGKKSYIFYRFPSNTAFSIVFKNNKLYSTNLQIYQLNEVIKVPVEIIKSWYIK